MHTRYGALAGLALLFIGLNISCRLFDPNVGLVDHWLNPNVQLPTPREAITPRQAQLAARRHIVEILAEPLTEKVVRRQYWEDYQSVLRQYPTTSKALPVLIDTKKNAEPRIARYLVGLQMPEEGMVGGFIAIDPTNGDVQCRLMWAPDPHEKTETRLEPLWQIPEDVWQNANSINDIEALAELIPPYPQFTAGIPVDIADALRQGFTFVGEDPRSLPLKTQEERHQQISWINQNFDLDLGTELGRRSGTSKCLSVATSYAADWWAVHTGHTPGYYTNPIGGQREYGFNPRMIESIFYQRAQIEGGFLSGDFRMAPLSGDKVTGEPIPFSVRGYARILTETQEAITADNLAPQIFSYETRVNHFYMDQPPLLIQIGPVGVLGGFNTWQDMQRAKSPSPSYTLAQHYGEAVAPEQLAKALDTWGPLLVQHRPRTPRGNPLVALFGLGIHTVLMVGYGRDSSDQMLFVYRESFGPCTHTYIEDSYLGPSYRMMPISYFRGAIAFPHHLYPKLESINENSKALQVDLRVTTNRERDPISPDLIRLLVDDKPVNFDISFIAKGLARIRIDISLVKHARKIEVRVAKSHFADAKGRNGFGIAAKHTELDWVVNENPLEPILMILRQ